MGCLAGGRERSPGPGQVVFQKHFWSKNGGNKESTVDGQEISEGTKNFGLYPPYGKER